MGIETGIEWADSTLNIWFGCTKITPACDFCYAEAWAKRSGLVKWGNHPRVAAKHWRKALADISKKALKKGGPHFVFVNSLSDFFDNQADPALRAEALEEFRKHPHLTFLLLTKRPQNIIPLIAPLANAALESEISRSMSGLQPPRAFEPWEWPHNVAIGTTIEDRKRLEKNAPALADAIVALNPAFGFWSVEPLLEDLGNVEAYLCGPAAIAWMIVGGESGGNARPTHPAWVRPLRDSCLRMGVAFLFKQWGTWHADALLHTDLAGNCPPPRMKIGKKLAGRLLDGIEHNDRPRIAA